MARPQALRWNLATDPQAFAASGSAPPQRSTWMCAHGAGLPVEGGRGSVITGSLRGTDRTVREELRFRYRRPVQETRTLSSGSAAIVDTRRNRRDDGWRTDLPEDALTTITVRANLESCQAQQAQVWTTSSRDLAHGSCSSAEGDAACESSGLGVTGSPGPTSGFADGAGNVAATLASSSPITLGERMPTNSTAPRPPPAGTGCPLRRRTTIVAAEGSLGRCSNQSELRTSPRPDVPGSPGPTPGARAGQPPKVEDRYQVALPSAGALPLELTLFRAFDRHETLESHADNPPLVRNITTTTSSNVEKYNRPVAGATTVPRSADNMMDRRQTISHGTLGAAMLSSAPGQCDSNGRARPDRHGPSFLVSLFRLGQSR